MLYSLRKAIEATVEFEHEIQSLKEIVDNSHHIASSTQAPVPKDLPAGYQNIMETWGRRLRLPREVEAIPDEDGGPGTTGE